MNFKSFHRFVLMPCALVALGGSDLGAVEFITLRRTVSFPVGGVTIKCGNKLDGTVQIREVTFDGEPGPVLASWKQPSQAYRLEQDNQYCVLEFTRAGAFTGFEMDLTFTPPRKGSSVTLHITSKPSTKAGIEVGPPTWYPATSTGDIAVNPGRNSPFFIKIKSF